MFVSIDVVDASHRRPVFVLTNSRKRKERLLLGVGPVPLFGNQQLMHVRRVLERIVLGITLARFDRGNLAPDGDHGITETIQLALGFAFRRLDHHRVVHRP